MNPSTIVKTTKPVRARAQASLHKRKILLHLRNYSRDVLQVPLSSSLLMPKETALKNNENQMHDSKVQLVKEN
jgi:hypothetical protein